jgi:hypothetical protein
MTTLEQFIGAFNIKFYAATSVSSMGWTNEELCEFFNSAQLQLIEELAGMGNIDAISDLVTESGEIAVTFSSGTYKYKVDVSTNLDDYFYYLSGTLEISKINPTAITSEAFPLDKISIKDVPNFTATTDNVTFFKRPKIALGSDTSSKLTIVIDAFTTDIRNLVINYISKPDSFIESTSQITNLNEALHNRIVSLAVEIAVRTMVNTQNSNQ